LRKMIDDDPADVRAWSMYAATTMQMCDATADEAEKSKLARELEESVIPEMEKQSRSPVDYYVLTTKAFVLMRKGREKRDAGREEALSKAREALLAAAKERPDVQATQDLVLGLDISLNDTVQAESHAREVLRRNRKAPLANYVMGSLALQKGDYSDAEAYLRRAADASRPVSLAQNDLAEVYRRTKRYGEAERYARMAIRSDPALYVAYETLGAVLMDSGGDLDEAEELVGRACELSKGEGGREEDVRMLVSLARVQIAKGDATRGKMTLRKVQSRIKELSDFERREFEDLQKSVR
ncbi:MAG: tetratricopeptide repeat protein, partial [Kiritimatiellae bacterium]|nr:tetratricopeptide repeat protein [Kiritimatiellia bacterium]